MPAERSPLPRSLLPWAILLASAAAALCVRPVREPDPLWHMTLGRAVLDAGARTVPEPTSYLGAGELRVVPEWLWGVGTLGLYQLGGWPLLQAWLALVVAACAVTTVVLLWRLAGPRGTPALLVSGLVVAQVAGRARLRPHALALLLIPAALLAIQAYREATGRARWWWGGALVLLEIAWAQVHGSFVLVPALFLAAALPDGLRHRDRRRLVADGLVLLALALGLLTSAYGLDVGRYVADHAAGDAAAHVSELLPPDWASFHPWQRLVGPLYVGLWVLGLAGMARARRPWWTELGWAAIGLVLFATATRFAGTASLLAAPLAARGLAALTDRARRRDRLRWIAALLVVLVLGRFGVRIHQRVGPLGQVGLAEGHHPVAAAAYLAGQPPGARVFGELTVGPLLAFELGDHVATSVDTRTPLHFDDAEYGLARDALVHPDALHRTLSQHRATAAVVYRAGPVCGALAPGWVPVVVEPRFTTFVPATDAPPLEVVQPCGPEFLPADACREDTAPLRRDLQRLAALGESPFLDLLRAEAAVRCDAEPARAEALLPPRADVRAFRPAWDRTRARVLLARDDLEGAAAVLEPAIGDGDLAALATVAPALLADGDLDRGRELLEAYAVAADDGTPPDVRADLAWVCARQGDAECARFHGLRAAARGSPRAIEPLRWLAEHARDEATRTEAAAWLDLLEAEVAR